MDLDSTCVYIYVLCMHGKHWHADMRLYSSHPSRGKGVLVFHAFILASMAAFVLSLLFRFS